MTKCRNGRVSQVSCTFDYLLNVIEVLFKNDGFAIYFLNEQANARFMYRRFNCVNDKIICKFHDFKDSYL